MIKTIKQGSVVLIDVGGRLVRGTVDTAIYFEGVCNGWSLELSNVNILGTTNYMNSFYWNQQEDGGHIAHIDGTPYKYWVACEYILDTVRQRSEVSMSGFQCVVPFDSIQSQLGVSLDGGSIGGIERELARRDEVADVLVDLDGFDVVMYTGCI